MQVAVIVIVELNPPFDSEHAAVLHKRIGGRIADGTDVIVHAVEAERLIDQAGTERSTVGERAVVAADDVVCVRVARPPTDQAGGWRNRRPTFKCADVAGCILWPRDSALISSLACGVVSGVDGRAAGQQCVCLGRTAVVGQHVQLRTHVREVAGGVAENRTVGRVADEVVAVGDDIPHTVRPVNRGSVPSQNRILDRGTSVKGTNPSAGIGVIIRDGHVVQLGNRDESAAGFWFSSAPPSPRIDAVVFVVLPEMVLLVIINWPP